MTFAISEIALAIFDCINSDGVKHEIEVPSEAVYRRVMSDLIGAHQRVPIDGVQAFVFNKGVITFKNGSTIRFVGFDVGNLLKTSSEASKGQAEQNESFDEFLDNYLVIS